MTRRVNVETSRKRYHDGVIKGPGCVFWSKRTTNLPARRCGAMELFVVPLKRVPLQVCPAEALMCRTHRTEYLKTGVITGYAEASKFYSTRQYRPVARRVLLKNVTLGKRKYGTR